MNNRDIDKLIGIHVFGYRVIDDGEIDDLGYQLVTSAGHTLGSQASWYDPEDAWNDCYKFSTSIGATWLIFDALPLDVWLHRLENSWEQSWSCIMQKRGGIYYQSGLEDTASLAICVAVLKVFGINIRAESNIIPLVHKG